MLGDNDARSSEVSVVYNLDLQQRDNSGISEVSQNLLKVRQTAKSMLEILDEMEEKIDRAANHLDILLNGNKNVLEARNNIEMTRNKVSDLFEYFKISSKPLPLHLLQCEKGSVCEFFEFMADWNSASARITEFDFKLVPQLKERLAKPVTDALAELIVYFEQQLLEVCEGEISVDMTKWLSRVVEVMRDSSAAHGIEEPDWKQCIINYRGQKLVTMLETIFSPQADKSWDFKRHTSLGSTKGAHMFYQVKSNISSWLKILEDERAICEAIIGDEHPVIIKKIFKEIIHGAMQLFFKEIEGLIPSASAENVTVEGFVTILDTIKFLSKMEKPFHTVLAFESQFGHKMMNLLFKKYTSYAGQMLDLLIYKIISGCATDDVLPENAAYAEVTVISCNLSISLCDCLETLDFVIEQNKISYKPLEEIRQILMDVLKQKADNYCLREYSVIFLLNNYSYIEENLPRHYPKGSKLQKFFNDLEKNINLETSNYLNTLNKCLPYLSLPEPDGRILKMEVRRDRHLLKDRFKRFNAEIRRIYYIYSKCRIPSKTFRKKILNLSQILLDSYASFYEFCNKLGFMTDSRKCIVHSPESLQILLGKLFVE